VTLGSTRRLGLPPALEMVLSNAQILRGKRPRPDITITKTIRRSRTWSSSPAARRCSTLDDPEPDLVAVRIETAASIAASHSPSYSVLSLLNISSTSTNKEGGGSAPRTQPSACGTGARLGRGPRHRPRRRVRGVESDELTVKRGRFDAVIAGLLFMSGDAANEVSALRWVDVAPAAAGDGVLRAAGARRRQCIVSPPPSSRSASSATVSMMPT